MRYAKLENNYLYYAPNPIMVSGNWYGNPPGSVYEAEGYKPVRYAEQPKVEPGYIAIPSWCETETEIVQTWSVETKPITEDEALSSYANELTGSNAETLQEATENLIKYIKED